MIPVKQLKALFNRRRVRDRRKLIPPITLRFDRAFSCFKYSMSNFGQIVVWIKVWRAAEGCSTYLDMLYFTSIKAQEILWAHNFRHDINEYFIVTLRDLKMTCLETDIQMFCTSKCINKLVFIQEESDEVKFEKVNKLKKWLKEYVVIF